MERLDGISKYFSEKERKRLDGMRDKKCGLPDMSPDEIKQSCRENDGYETPELNDKLYLHFRGFKRIQNLEPYTGCKAIWLDSNGLEKLEGLSSLIELRCLYLAKNLLTKIEGLENLQQLTLLDLSNNRLSQLENLSCCPMLQTLNVSRNAFTSSESIKHLTLCTSLQNIDITNNHLDGDGVISVFATVPALTALSINGNPITQMPGFRKRAIIEIKRLSYLDRPIDEVERVGAVAFLEGGIEAEKVARENWREVQKEKKTQETLLFRAWQEEQLRLRNEEGYNGRCTITEFTPEELAERQAEAEKAAAAERQMLQIGIGKVATKYWQLEGRNSSSSSNSNSLISNHSIDPLDAAIDAAIQEETSQLTEKANAIREQQLPFGISESVLLQENLEETSLTLNGSLQQEVKNELSEIGNDSLPNSHNQMSINESTPYVDIAVGIVEREEEEEDSDSNSNSAAKLYSSTNGVIDSSSTVRDSTHLERNEIKEQKQDMTEVNAITSIPSSITDELVSWGEEEEEVKEEGEEESQEIRDQRVQESLRIYYSSQHNNNTSDDINVYQSMIVTNQSPSTSSSLTNSYLSTWDDPLPANGTSQYSVDIRPIYWSEDMDLALGKFVRQCAFDFDRIAVTLSAEAEAGLLGSDASRVADRIDADACRVRWTQLDARQWAELGPATSPLETLFKICVQPSVLGKGHGAQPDFQAMAAIAAGSMPAYLTVPTVFPSVRDITESDDDDEEEEEEEEDVDEDNQVEDNDSNEGDVLDGDGVGVGDDADTSE